MDYYQGVVIDYLRALRSRFVNPECLIQLTPGTPDKGRHWYCDAVAVDFKDEAVYLCEVTYSKNLAPLLKRLEGWRAHWLELCRALARDCGVPSHWRVQPWVFLPEAHEPLLLKSLPAPADAAGMPVPTVTHLEKVAPWRYPWYGEEYEATAALIAAARHSD